MSRKKLLFFIGNLDKGGAERIASILLTCFASSDFEVSLCFTTSNMIQYSLHPSIKIFSVYNTSAYKKIFLIRILIKQIKPDHIISFLPHINIKIILASIGLKSQVIVCERIHPFFYKKNYIIRLLRFFLYGFADTVVYQTKAARQDLIYLGKKLSKEFVIPNPCDENILKVKANSSVKEIVTIGRLDLQKRQKLLIDYFNAIHNKYPEWRLRIVGKGPLEDQLKKYVQTLGLEHKIIFEGLVSNIPDFIQSFSIFCLTSDYEGFPNALLEAMGAGLAIISFDCLSGPMEMTANGECGIIVNQNDHDGYINSLCLLMGHESLRRSLGNLAKERVERMYQIDTVYQMWVNLLRNENSACNK